MPNADYAARPSVAFSNRLAVAPNAEGESGLPERERPLDGDHGLIRLLHSPLVCRQHTRAPSPKDGSASARPVLRQPPATLQPVRSEEHTSELQSHSDLVCRLLLVKKII